MVDLRMVASDLKKKPYLTTDSPTPHSLETISLNAFMGDWSIYEWYLAVKTWMGDRCRECDGEKGEGGKGSGGGGAN